MDGQDGSSRWISSEESRTLVHEWRATEDAILVGTRTAFVDNPQLTARHTGAVRQPLRAAIDRQAILPSTHHLLDGSVPTLIFSNRRHPRHKQVEVCELGESTGDAIPEILKALYERSIQSLVVEGGAVLLESFLRRQLWDEARVFVCSPKFGVGVAAPVVDKSACCSVSEEKTDSGDKLYVYRRTG